MVMEKTRKDELRREGFISGAEEVKEKNIEKGKRDGRFKALRNMFCEAIENQFGEVDKSVQKKIKYIYDIDLLKKIIIMIYECENVKDIYKYVHEQLSDEEMYRREGYETAINNAEGFYGKGREEGFIHEKLSMILSIFKNRFGYIEIELEAAIMTKDLEERIDELFFKTFEIYDKKELINYIKSTMTLANSWKGVGYVLGYKSTKLSNMINVFFDVSDIEIDNKIKRIKNIEDWATFMDDTRYINNEKEFKDFSQTGTPWRFEGAGYYYSTGEPVTEEMEEDNE